MRGAVTLRKLRGAAVAERPGETPAPRRALLKFSEGIVGSVGFDGGGESGHGGEFAEHRGEPGVATGGTGSDEREGGVEDTEDEGNLATGGVDHFSGCASACLMESVGSEFGRAGEGGLRRMGGVAWLGRRRTFPQRTRRREGCTC